MPAAIAAPGGLPFAVEFGQAATADLPRDRGHGLGLHIPVLGGMAREALFSGTGIFSRSQGLNLVTTENLLIGWMTTPLSGEERPLVGQTQRLYRQAIEAARGRHLYRIWNYIPAINEVTDGLENYRAFCQGRSLAFEEALGRTFPQGLSAASAVGTDDRYLSLIFVAGVSVPKQVENPEQLPAYRYPAEHGPRPPSFSRATVVQSGGRRFTFISGTSSIKGHATVAPGSLPEQLVCTLDNLRIVSREAGAGKQLDAPDIKERHFKIYLRHADDFAAARDFLSRELLRPGDIVTYLRTDICRATLRVEIEATLIA